MIMNQERTVKNIQDIESIEEVFAAAMWCSSEISQYFGRQMYFDPFHKKLVFYDAIPVDANDLYEVECRLEDLKKCINIIKEKTEIK